MNAIKFPHITVDQDGGGEAFSLLARVKLALRMHGVTQAEIDAFIEEAMAGDFHHMIQTIKGTVRLV